MDWPPQYVNLNTSKVVWDHLDRMKQEADNVQRISLTISEDYLKKCKTLA